MRTVNESSWIEVVLSPDLPNSLRLSVALAVVLALTALWRLIRPGRVGWMPWAGEGRRRYAELGALPPAQADGIVMGEAEPPCLGNLAAARPGAAGGPRRRRLASRTGAAEGLCRPGPHRPAARPRWAALAGASGRRPVGQALPVLPGGARPVAAAGPAAQPGGGRAAGTRPVG